MASGGLEELKARYKENLPLKMAELEDLFAKLKDAGWEAHAGRTIYGICHNLMGTAQTFGFPAVTREARNVTAELKSIFDNAESPDTALDALHESADRLIAAYQEEIAIESDPTGSNDNPEYNSYDPDQVYPLSILPIYIVEDDRDLADHIVMEMALQGYDARAIYRLEDLEQQVLQTGTAIGAIVMDIIFPQAVTGGIDLINSLRSRQILKAPVIFISASDSFETRLEVVRAGGDAFFVKPFDTNLLIDKLESLIGDVAPPDPLRVLIVDDEEIAAAVVSTVLEDAGLMTKVIHNPTVVIETVLEFEPDLLILDMHMPEASGMEVAVMMRQHEACADLPILFLSAETDPEIRASALNVGVDDFLIKPVDHRYLVSAVANRAQRARALGNKIYKDSLTHLLVHDEIEKQLGNMISNAARYGRDLSYIILDIDHFKQVNDQYGHLTGDHVIKSLSSLLRRSFRRSDIVGRYGGEEFVVIMQDSTPEDASIVVNRVREEFASMSHVSEADGERFNTTFSAGIASFPQYQEDQLLQSYADKALYDAKHAGRNQVIIADY